MGYTTHFEGSVNIDPLLSEQEILFLEKFSKSRRINSTKGPYHINENDYSKSDILDYNFPPKEQPSLWCNWVPGHNGTCLEWNGAEKFYSSPEWMQYLIDHFLAPNAKAKSQLQFFGDHIVNGIIHAKGEDPNDVWRLVVVNNNVHVEM